MLRFEHKEYFFLLLLIPIVISIYFYVQYQTKKQLEKIGNIDLMKRLMPDRNEKKSLLNSLHLMLFYFF
jgi:Ca-activated chloride channel family protein